jgi:hypothetical protein
MSKILSIFIGIGYCLIYLSKKLVHIFNMFRQISVPINLDTFLKIKGTVSRDGGLD